MINARAETIDQKASFRHSFYHRRCLIPAGGFYEWRRYNGPKNLNTNTGGLKTQMSVRKRYPADFKSKIVLEILKEEKSLSQISS
ncbi:SOS response-associated peptidase family protein, partial [Desulfoscipio geothermicus]|uniref:SOS response-associated peptidase family protein n=1 Tax=Desulfoscipio geothermicus TaxID=39060 RepID=UPI0013F4C219